MSEKRWASRSLVNMLVNELRDYKSAAEVVSGADDVFQMCADKINEKITQVQNDPSAASGLELQQALAEAQQEINDHFNWQKEVLEALPTKHDEDGLTGPLRQAFAKTAKSRDGLQAAVTATSERFFSDQK